MMTMAHVMRLDSTTNVQKLADVEDDAVVVGCVGYDDDDDCGTGVATLALQTRLTCVSVLTRSVTPDGLNDIAIGNKIAN